jgi:hypothetical protein
MRNLLWGLTVVSALWSAGAQAGKCSDTPMIDGLIANMQQQAANAEQRAANARTPQERARWEETARSLSLQADAAGRRQAAMGTVADVTYLCNMVLKSDVDSDD